jgi:ABC-2 type transport system permease protein
MSLLKTLTRILAIVGKELITVVRRPGALISLVIGPFLIMALFGVGYSGYRRALDTILVIPEGTGLSTDVNMYQQVAGESLHVAAVTADLSTAMRLLDAQQVDVVVVAPADSAARLQAGQRSLVSVRVNLADPVQESYAVFVTRSLEGAINRQIVEQAVQKGQAEAISQGASDAGKIPPDVIAAPAEAVLDNVAPSRPTVVQYFGPAVLALILQHLAITLIALSVVRERSSGLFELFRISPISTFELLTGKLVAYGIFAGAVALITIALLVIGFQVPMLADPGWIAIVVLLLVAASLGLGLLVASISDSEPQAVQLSLLLLLASVFFSGFVLAIDQFREPVRSLLYALPVSNGIRLLEDLMFRGATVASWQIGLMAGLAVAYIFLAWFLLRRAMARA